MTLSSTTRTNSFSSRAEIGPLVEGLPAKLSNSLSGQEWDRSRPGELAKDLGLLAGVI